VYCFCIFSNILDLKQEIQFYYSTIVINFHQDFMVSTYSDFFQGQIDRGLIYWRVQSGKIRLSNQDEWLKWVLKSREISWRGFKIGTTRFSIMTFSIMTLIIMDIIATLTINVTQQNGTLLKHSRSSCWVSHVLIVMLSAIKRLSNLSLRVLIQTVS